MDWREVVRQCMAVERRWDDQPAISETRPPLTTDQILRLEKRMGERLPASYVELLGFSDGLTLFRTPKSWDLSIDLFSSSMLPGHYRGYYEMQDIERASLPVFPVGVLGGVGDFIVVLADTGEVFWESHEDTNDRARVGRDLKEFVLNLASRRGSWWWLPGFDVG